MNDRLRTSARLVTLIVLLVIPGAVAGWSYASTMTSQKSFAARERAGLQVTEPALAAEAAAVQGAAVDLQPVQSAVAAHPELGLAGPLDAVRGAVAGAPRGGPAVAQALASFIVAAGNASNLILDPDLDSFYVMDLQVVQVPNALAAAADAARPIPAGERPRAAERLAVDAGQLSSTGQAMASDLATARKATSDGAALSGLAAVTAASRSSLDLSARITSTLSHPAPADARGLAAAAATAVHPSAQALDRLLRTRMAGLTHRRDLVLSIALLAFCLAGYFGFVTWWRTRRDVGTTVRAVAAIASGVLAAQPLPRGRDEFGDIARSLETARATLAEQAEQLAAAHVARAEQQKAEFGRQRAAERQVRARAQEIVDGSADTMLEELTALCTEVDAVRRSAGEIEKRVNAAEAVTRHIVERAAQADAGAVALADSLRGVGGMTKLIGTVADQTKLLALNATIEAMRAGSAGQGFSVVASEVKALATTTAESTGRINATLEQLESNAGDVGRAINGVGQDILSLDEATTALTNVATEQFALVGRLDAALAATMDRVRGLTSLTENLERRQDERHPVTGTATLLAQHRTIEARLLDLSAGGLRCSTKTQVPLTAGQSMRVQVRVGDAEFTVDATVVRQEAGDLPTDIGLRFTDAECPAALQAILDAR